MWEEEEEEGGGKVAFFRAADVTRPFERPIVVFEAAAEAA